MSDRRDTLWISLAICLAALAACKPNDTVIPPSPGNPTGSPTGTGTPGATPSTGSPDSTAPLPVFDCATVPPNLISAREVPDARGYHDVAFTEDGYILGNSYGNQDLMKVDGLGSVETLVNNIGQLQQMVWLPDGDLAVASDNSGAILRVTATGTVTPISPNVWAYGLIMGPDGFLWVANQNVVMRIDIATGQQEVLIASIPSGAPRVINFNRDFTRLYIGTLGGNGNLFFVELDANYDPITPPAVFANNVGTGAYHDGMGVDICGFLYVPDYPSDSLYRISPSGQVQTYFQDVRARYGHGLEWGNGVGQWRTDAIYLPLPYGQNHVAEMVIGVPTVWEGTVINAPQP